MGRIPNIPPWHFPSRVWRCFQCTDSSRAINVNIQIIRIFTRIRQVLADNTDIRLEIEKIKNKLDNQDKNMEIVFRYLDELLERRNIQIHRESELGLN